MVTESNVDKKGICNLKREEIIGQMIWKINIK